MNNTKSKVDAFFHRAEQWQDEMRTLRAIILDCGLTEELKWGKPCYTYQDSNVVIIIPLKEHCALMFCQGALLEDADRLLTRPGEHTQAGRWIKFATVADIERRQTTLKAYIREAVAARQAGRKVKLKQTADYKVPAELDAAFAASPRLQAAFAALTPGRQRGYLLHFAAPKQATTRSARIEKCTPRILDGLGLTDR